jgi:hypothetical protein
MQALLPIGAAMLVCGVVGVRLARRGVLPVLAQSEAAASAYALFMACLVMGGIGLMAVQFL